MFTIKEILQATDGKLIRGCLSQKVTAVSCDSRTIKPKELFIAICGKRFDGHRFIPAAVRRGAGAILFSDIRYETKQLPDFVSMIRVKDTLFALGDLANYHRARFPIPVIAVTGSNGKTTTKEMLSKILQKRFNVLRNPGTENNLIGVPQTLFKLTKRHNLVVIEIGANHPGEIERLSRIIQPTAGIITNIGPSHLEFFQNLRGVFQAKLELIKNLTKDAKLIINKDDRFLSKLNSTNFRTITFGLDASSDFYAQGIIQTQEQLSFWLNKRHHLVLKVLGRHNIYNALASIACARCFGISFSEIKHALASFELLPMRMQLLKIKNIKLINDCYNANPESLRCALAFLNEYPNRGRRIVVCADMLELGKQAEKLHMDIGKMMAKDKIDYLITVGRLAKHIAAGAYLVGMPRNSIRKFYAPSQAGNFLRKFIKPRDIILIKGSRAMQMEKVAECFTNSSIH